MVPPLIFGINDYKYADFKAYLEKTGELENDEQRARYIDDLNPDVGYQVFVRNPSVSKLVVDIVVVLYIHDARSYRITEMKQAVEPQENELFDSLERPKNPEEIKAELVRLYNHVGSAYLPIEVDEMLEKKPSSWSFMLLVFKDAEGQIHLKKRPFKAKTGKNGDVIDYEYGRTTMNTNYSGVQRQE